MTWLRPGALLSLVNLGLGFVLLVGAPERTSSASFAVPKEWLPIQAWGLVFLVGALVCAFAHGLGRRGAIAVALGAGIHAFWATALWQSADADPKAALTGGVVYSWLALCHVVTGYRMSREVR